VERISGENEPEIMVDSSLQVKSICFLGRVMMAKRKCCCSGYRERKNLTDTCAVNLPAAQETDKVFCGISASGTRGWFCCGCYAFIWALLFICMCSTFSFCLVL
jgi:hypothetical protein